LPNGNTLIDEGMSGRIFQITREGGIVWEYMVPFFGVSKVDGKTFATPLTYRAQPVPYDWIPEGTPHSEKTVKEIDVTTFHVP